jgi:hypothetical protein
MRDIQADCRAGSNGGAKAAHISIKGGLDAPALGQRPDPPQI